jgi:hypothetical protein
MFVLALDHRRRLTLDSSVQTHVLRQPSDWVYQLIGCAQAKPSGPPVENAAHISLENVSQVKTEAKELDMLTRSKVYSRVINQQSTEPMN